MTAGAPLVVVVTGPESTGKTTLAERLAGRFETTWSPEHARRYVDARLAVAGSAPLGPEDVEPIARGQIVAEDIALAATGARTVTVRDTDLVSTVVYARHYYGACPAWIVDAARARRGALYLLCDVDVPWVPDAQRDRPHARERLCEEFAQTLAELGCRVTPIAGAWAEREARAIAAVDALLRERDEIGAAASRPREP